MNVTFESTTHSDVESLLSTARIREDDRNGVGYLLRSQTAMTTVTGHLRSVMDRIQATVHPRSAVLQHESLATIEESWLA